MSLKQILARCHRRWTGWSLPTRAGLTLATVALLFSVFAWLFPSLGPRIIELAESASNRPRDADDVQKERKREAALEAMDFRDPSAETAIAKLVREPRFKDERLDYSESALGDRFATFVVLSPIKTISGQEFAGGRCEIWSIVDDLDAKQAAASIRVHDLRCSNTSDGSYLAIGSNLGYVASMNSIGHQRASLARIAGQLTLPAGNYLVRFTPPIQSMQRTGP